MGSSVEGLKLRRMRIRNEISFNRSTEERTEWAEDLEALREELRRVSKSRSRKPNSRGGLDGGSKRFLFPTACWIFCTNS